MAFGLALAATGCVSSSIEQLRQTPPIVMDEGEGVVVLGRRHENDSETEIGFSQCVADELAGEGVSVYPEARFMDRLYPWFEPRTAPLATESLPRLVNDPVIGQRLRETGVRYVVWLDGATRDTDDGGSMSCAVGPGGGGCLGFMWWEKQAAYEASVWDLQDIRSVGKVSVDASGTSYVPAIIVPVPLIARTQSAACGGVAGQLGEFFSGRVP